MNSKQLIKFEKEIFDIYESGKIKGVIHLSGSKDKKYEKELVKFFKKIKKRDWVFSNHRNHYHVLLKAGKEFCKNNILDNYSMHQYSKKHRVFTSGIVCGQVPIALGMALSLKLKREKGHVYCFVGDMSSEMGSFYVCVKYALFHKLPITFIIEDNQIAVYTPTREAWMGNMKNWPRNVKTLNYERKYPHHGTGKFIHF